MNTKKGGPEAAKKMAEKSGLKIKDDNTITVLLILKPGINAEEFDKTKIERFGAKNYTRYHYIGRRYPNR